MGRRASAGGGGIAPREGAIILKGLHHCCSNLFVGY